MNIIQKHKVEDLGYNFIEPEFLPKGKDEYYLRNKQNKTEISYRNLHPLEIKVLVRNGNTSDNWNMIYVSNEFNPEQIKHCTFYGLIRIGKLEPYYNEFHNLRMPVGLYNSTIISCDIGNNVCIDNVNYLSHYIIKDDVMIANTNEIACTDHSKFGNGILREGENEQLRVWMEICNENGGRGVLPFDGMLPGDAWIWSHYRDDEKLMQKFKEFTENKFDKKRGEYGIIGERTVIKNCKIIKDVTVGTDAYFKGANKLKNLTINSDNKRKTQIGEGCELVNGIVGYGCRIFYGVKAVRFVMASHSQLKYGARLLNSYLGNNSTISCCEVLNSLIFPAHEQHHNNSFLCASLVMGQSNIAAGATIGSNHNSRSADGEIIAGRGFWPGLCVSLKHNSKFASFTILSKGDYPAELNIPIPFSLVSNDLAGDKIVVMPGYWFLYNMYALVRNARKYQDRDRRTEKIQGIEYDYLAPDSINELFDSLRIMEPLQVDKTGAATISGWENSNRVTELIKVPEAKKIFIELIRFYGIRELIKHQLSGSYPSFDHFKKSIPVEITRTEWVNAGGQLIKIEELNRIKQSIKTGKLKSWDEMHVFYREQGKHYEADKLQHAFTSLLEILNITSRQFTLLLFKQLLNEAVDTQNKISKGILDSRAKDYSNPFRRMVYETMEELNKVIGKLEDNVFIQENAKEADEFSKHVKSIIKKWESK